jgi:hypothetical protein
MPEYRPRRVIAKLMTATMIADELGIPRSTAESVMWHIEWKYGLVRIKGLRRNFVRRADLERELERARAMIPNPDGPGRIPEKLMTIAMIAHEQTVTVKEADRIAHAVCVAYAHEHREELAQCRRLDEYHAGGVEIADLRRAFYRRANVERRVREGVPYVPVRPPGLMTRPEIADELGISLNETEALLRFIFRRENWSGVLDRFAGKDYFRRDIIERYVHDGNVPERVALAMRRSP